MRDAPPVDASDVLLLRLTRPASDDSVRFDRRPCWGCQFVCRQGWRRGLFSCPRAVKHRIARKRGELHVCWTTASEEADTSRSRWQVGRWPAPRWKSMRSQTRALCVVSRTLGSFFLAIHAVTDPILSITTSIKTIDRRVTRWEA